MNKVISYFNVDFFIDVLLFFRNMMVLRFHGEELVFPTPLHQVSPRIPQMNMMKVHIPFTFKLLETSKSSYAGKSGIAYN